MVSIPKKDKQTTKKQIVDTFKKYSIELHPAGVWKWDENRIKTPIDAKRTDGLTLSKYPKDNILKHRAELSGVAVIDCDGVPLDKVDQWFPSSVDTFTTTTSSHKKQHRYLFPPEGKTFPESRAIKDLHKDLDVITSGIVFEAHDYLSKDTQFSMNNIEIKRCTMVEYDLICEILEPKQKAPKQNKKADNKNPIIAKFNQKYSCEELLMAQDYMKINNRLIHPESESGIPGIFIFPDGCVYSHSSDWLNDGSSHDAFDIYSHYEHNDDKSKALASAKDLLNLNYYGFKRSKEIIDHKRLRYIKSQIGYSPRDRYFYMLTPKGKLIQSTKADLWEFIARSFPPPFGYELIEDEAEKEHKKKDDQKKFIDDIKSKIASVQEKVIYDLKYNNSFTMLEYNIDPFAQESTITITGDIMRVAVNNLFPSLDINEIKYDYTMSKKVYDDFKQHFPEFTQFLDLIIASRFGADRKKTFVYTQMASDFGKSFLGAVFARLGLLVQMKEKELKKAFSGEPVAMDATEFQTAWILFFDEFKQAVSELKDITHHLTLSPKNQMRQKVQLYTKWSASKESSQSLVGNGGVDDQFANRFSMIDTGTQKLTDRELYTKDNNAYFDALTYAVYSVIKNKSNKYIAMGKVKAGVEANKVVDKFRSKYALKATLNENTEELVDEMIDYLNMHAVDDPFESEIKDLGDLARYTFVKHEGVLYLRKPDATGRFFEDFAKDRFGERHFHKISYQKKALRDRFGGRNERTSISIGGKSINVYPLFEEL